MKKNLYFFTEGRFIKNDQGIYSLGGFPYELWKRYLAAFSHVTVVARVRQADTCQPEGNRSDGENVDFLELPYYEGPMGYMFKKRRVKRLYKSIIGNYDDNAAVICRLPGVVGGTFAQLADRYNIQYSCEVVGDPWDVYSPGSMKHLLRPFLRVYFSCKLRSQVSKARQVLYVTKDYLQKRYPAKSAIFVTYASNVRIPNSSFSTRTYKEKPISNPIKLLSIGSLEQMYKAPDVVLKAIRILKDKGVKCELVWLGSGKYHSSMEELADSLSIKELVRFVGSVEHERVYDYIKQSDIYLQVSRTEGLPRALIEAMTYGLVCVGTRVGGIPELLSEECLINRDNVEELANCIERLSTNEELCLTQRKRNFEKAKEYSEPILSKRRLAFYDSIINN